MMVVVAYDIATGDAEGARRLRRVHRLCSDWGHSIQNSVFECRVDAGQYRALRQALLGIIHPERDSVRFYLLGNRYEGRIQRIGTERRSPPPQSFVLP